MAKFNKQYFTANGSWTAPAGVTEVLLIGCGGGGGGGGAYSSTPYVGGGGGSGAIQRCAYVSVTPNTSYTVTIGAGGSSGGNGANGGNGQPTTFGSTLFKAYGAQGGAAGLSASVGYIAPNVNDGTNNRWLLPGEQHQAACGGYAKDYTLAVDGQAGMSNWSGNGSYTGGTGGTHSGTTSGAGGGGAGPQGNGANAPNTVASGNGTNGNSAGANTGAGGSGGGSSPSAGGVGGVGGVGGSGYLYVIWVD